MNKKEGELPDVNTFADASLDAEPDHDGDGSPESEVEFPFESTSPMKS